MYTCNIRYSLMAEPTQSVAKKRLRKSKGPASLQGLVETWVLASGARADAMKSIPVMIRLERAFRLDPDVLGLVLAQLGQLDADLGEVQPGDLLVQRFRQHV